MSQSDITNLTGAQLRALRKLRTGSAVINKTTARILKEKGLVTVEPLRQPNGSESSWCRLTDEGLRVAEWPS